MAGALRKLIFPPLELCVDGTIRLFIGDDDQTFYHGEFNEVYYYNKDEITRGRVEYCVNETYYGICGDYWDYTHASVVCKQLGFSEFGKTVILNISSFLRSYVIL